MKWEALKLGDTATFVNGYPFKPTDWSSSGKEIIRIQNLTKSNGIDANRYSGTLPDKYLVRKGDLLISWSGTLGVYEWGGDDAWLNQHIFKVVFDKAEVNKVYFKYLIHSKLSEFERQVHGATMKHITKGKFDNTLVPLPPLHIQEQIADTLDKADALRRKDQEVLQKYDDLAEAIFYDMFGDTVEHNRGWPVRNLSSLLLAEEKISYGIVQPGDDTIGGIPVIRVGDFNDMGIDDQNLKKVSPEIEKQYTRTRLHGDEILIACVGSIGKVALVSPRHRGHNIVRATARIRVDPERINRTYLAYHLATQSTQTYFISETRTVSQPTLNISHIEKTVILIPPISLQNKFEDEVVKINKLKEKLAITFSYTNNLFETLIKSLVS